MKIYMLVGVSGSGKSTWAKTQVEEKGGTIISRDDIRFSLLERDSGYFDKEKEVYKIFIYKINQAIKENKSDIYIDATHLTENSRKKLINKLQLENKEEIIPVKFFLPLEECLRRNLKRRGLARVPDNVIGQMYKNITDPAFDKFIKYKKIIYVGEWHGKDISLL